MTFQEWLQQNGYRYREGDDATYIFTPDGQRLRTDSLEVANLQRQFQYDNRYSQPDAWGTEGAYYGGQFNIGSSDSSTETEPFGTGSVNIGGRTFIRTGTTDNSRFDPFITRPEEKYFFDPRYGWLVDAEIARRSAEAGDKSSLAYFGTGLALAAAPVVSSIAAGGAGATAGSSLPDSYWSMVADAGTGTATDAGAGIGLGEATSGFPVGATEAAFGSGAAPAATGTFGSMALPAGATAGTTGGAFPSLSTIGTVGSAVGGLAALAGAAGGQSITTSTAPISAEERELIALNAELTKRQLSAIDSMQPWQRRLLEMSMADLERQEAQNRAFDAAVTPEQQAAFMKAEFDRAQRLGPIQDEMLQMQLDAMRRNGAATPEQEALIKQATDAAISAGHGDIDASTSRGIGLIADELANARGLRLSDSPISGEAALLAREGEIQKGSLTRNLRAAEAQSRLNFPLAVQQLQSQIGMGQQNLAQSAAQFQADLRQRAYQNRLALTGQTASSGIGLSSIGGGSSGLNALTTSRLANTTRSASGIGIGELGQFASGAGGLIRGIGLMTQ